MSKEQGSKLIDELFDLQTRYPTQKVWMFYKGPVSQSTVVDIGSYLRGLFAEKQGIRTIFPVFVELAQNVLHHSADRYREPDQRNQRAGLGHLTLIETTSNYLLASGNLISSHNIGSLRNHLDEINALDYERLRLLFRQKRKFGHDPIDGGAGLGLIDMALKSRHPLVYDFRPLDGEKFFFFLQVYIEKT